MKTSLTQCSKPSAHSSSFGASASADPLRGQHSALPAQRIRLADNARPFTMPLTLPDELKHCTGKGVKVAIIDSGIKSDIIPKIDFRDGIAINYDSGCIAYTGDYEDNLGHGSYCVRLITHMAPNVELFVVKIFFEELIAEMDCLLEGIHWCINKNLNIINLSLGTSNGEDISGLKKVCAKAAQNNIFITSPIEESGYLTYPACIKNIIPVAHGKNNSMQNPIYNRAVKVNYPISHQYNSYANAHVTGLCALILEKYPQICLSQLIAYIIKITQVG